MNKQFILSVVVVFIVTMVLGFVVHSALLGPEYAKLSNMYRNEEDAMQYFHWMIIAHLTLAIGLTWIYRMGRQDKPWLAQGFRFGLAIFVLMTLTNFLVYYAVQYTPGALVARQIAFDGAGTIIACIVVAFMNR
jgi:uncharacterized BrkB/YihY/UPF0761 family membrane protein